MTNRNNRSPIHIDQSIAYRREPIPDNQNAFPLWRAAAESTVAIERGEEVCDAEDCSCSATDMEVKPSADEMNRRAEAIEKNRQAFDLIDTGIERGQLQFPEIPKPENFNAGFNLLGPWRDLAMARSWRIDQALADDDVPQAVHDVIALMRFGDLFCNGHGMILHYLCGNLFRRMARDALLLMAAQRLPRQALERLIEAVSVSARWPDGLEQAMIVDFFTFALPLIERLPAEGSTEELIDTLLTSHYEMQVSELSDEWAPDVDTRLAWRRDRLVQVFQGHRRPFDRAETIALMKRRLAEAVGEVRAPWMPGIVDFAARVKRWRRQWHDRRISRATKCWPFQLTPFCRVEGLGESDQARQWLARMTQVLGRRFSTFQAVTDRELPRVRRKLRTVSNPVGMLLAEYHSPSLYVRSLMLQHRLDLEVCKALLAMRIFAALRGRLPVTLTELVDTGILATIPRDPFSRGPVRYSAAKRVIWSVGQDGKNGRGRFLHWPSPGYRVLWEVPVV